MNFGLSNKNTLKRFNVKQIKQINQPLGRNSDENGEMNFQLLYVVLIIGLNRKIIPFVANNAILKLQKNGGLKKWKNYSSKF